MTEISKRNIGKKLISSIKGALASSSAGKIVALIINVAYIRKNLHMSQAEFTKTEIT